MSTIAKTPSGKSSCAIVVVNDAFSSSVDLEFPNMSRLAGTADVCCGAVRLGNVLGQCQCVLVTVPVRLLITAAWAALALTRTAWKFACKGQGANCTIEQHGFWHQ